MPEISGIRRQDIQELSNIVFTELVRRDPLVTPLHGQELSHLWSLEVSRIIQQVLKITEDAGRSAWHIDARTEAIFRMSELLLDVSSCLVESRLRGRTAAAIDIAQEETQLASSEVDRLRSQTAQTMADAVWIPLYDRLHTQYPLVVLPGGEQRIPRLPGRLPRSKQPDTRKNHFVPRFTIRPWADPDGNVRILIRRPGGPIHSHLGGYAQWGFEDFLYPNVLERYFQQIESRAASPYRQLIACRPLTPDDRYFLMAFLILQRLRTPAFMSELACRVRMRLRGKRSVTPEMMRRACFALFQNDSLFAAYSNLLSGRRWKLLAAADGMSYPRTDAPVVTVAVKGVWTCFYPLTPTYCLQVGPEFATQSDVPIALPQRQETCDTEALNTLLLARTRFSLVVRPVDDSAQWVRQMNTLPPPSSATSFRAWGSLTLR